MTWFMKSRVYEWVSMHYILQSGAVSGGGRGAISPSPYGFCLFGFFIGLSAKSRKVMVIISLPSCSAMGGKGAFAPPYDFRFVCLSAQRSVLPSTPTPLWKSLDKFLKSEKRVGVPPPPPPHTYTHTPPLSDFFRGGAQCYGSRSSSKTLWQFCPPPPPANIPWRRPLPYSIMVIIPPPPPADYRFQDRRNAQRDILPGLWKCWSITSLVWYGSGVAGCSLWGDSTCCGIGWG